MLTLQLQLGVAGMLGSAKFNRAQPPTFARRYLSHRTIPRTALLTAESDGVATVVMVVCSCRSVPVSGNHQSCPIESIASMIGTLCLVDAMLQVLQAMRAEAPAPSLRAGQRNAMRDQYAIL